MGPLTRAALKRKAGLLPDKPGIYFFKDGRGRVVYIGKARSLRDRVRSYFQPTDDPKVHNILAETADIEFILTGSEREAAFLENNFVRQHQPKFNLRLKDDKNFPFIKVTVRDPYPGVYLARRVDPDGARYFGPFSPALQARQTIRLLNKFFGLRACEEAVFRNRKRPCLEYDLRYCAAPCAGLVSPEEYRDNVANALLLLEGKTRELAEVLAGKMRRAAERREFEQAAHWRDALATIERLRDRPRLISVGQEDKDIWGFSRAGAKAGFLVFLMRKGRVSETREFLLDVQGADEPAGIMGRALEEFYRTARDVPGQVLVPVLPDDPERLAGTLTQAAGRKVRLVLPAKGRNRDLLDLTGRNAEVMMQRRQGEEAALEQIRDILGLDVLPRRIEGFDISNIGGTETVASSVVFEDGLPKKSEYKKYIIRSVEGPNDVAGIREVVGRRFAETPGRERLVPDLVLADGGKGQFQAARQALDAAGLGGLPLVSLAKREEIVFTAGTGEGLRLDRTSPALKLFQRIRDEAHRFAITFHRSRRTKRSFASFLDGIPGIGPKRKMALLLKFKSLEDIRDSPAEDVEALIGKAAAGALFGHIGREGEDHGHRDRD
jgi:excinuclease ABC subunit C